MISKRNEKNNTSEFVIFWEHYSIIFTHFKIPEFHTVLYLYGV